MLSKKGSAPRHLLKSFVAQLKKLKIPSNQISIKLATFVADAMTQYLSGKYKSLDEAFGLKSKRGIPGYPEQRQRLAKLIHKKRKRGKTFQSIANELEQAGHENPDPGTLRRTYEEFRLDLERDDLIAAIWTNVKKDMKEDNRKFQIANRQELERARERTRA